MRGRAREGGVRAGAVRGGARWFPVALGLCLAVALTFLTLPVVAIFVELEPGAS